MKAKVSQLTLLCFSALFFWVNISAVSAQTRKETIFERLTAEEGGALRLEMDFTVLLENRKTNQYFPAVLTDRNGKQYQVEVKPRGKFRRKICEVPPLKIKFKKKLLTSEGLDTLNELKLVMPCKDNDKGDELIIKEYLTYKMYEHLTSACVRARLVKLTLLDTHVEKKRVMYCMVVEDEEETAARMNGSLVEEYGLSPDSLVSNQAALACMFEYMVANTDWEIGMLRNVRLIKSRETGKTIVVPYDFDFSGLVAAPYASPSSESGLKTVRERFLMPYGLKPEYLKRATQQLKSAKKDLYAICRNKYLSRSATEEMINFLDSFFIQAEKSEDMPATMKAPEDTE